VRAVCNTSRLVKIEVEELESIYLEAFSSRAEESNYASFIKRWLRVGCFADNHTSLNTGVSINNIVSQRNFNSSLHVVSSLKVVESQSSDSLDNSSISSILVGNQVVEVALNQGVLVERIFSLRLILSIVIY